LCLRWLRRLGLGEAGGGGESRQGALGHRVRFLFATWLRWEACRPRCVLGTVDCGRCGFLSLARPDHKVVGPPLFCVLG
jgi:hypothetical protein